MRVNPWVYGAVVLTVFLGIILGFQSAGMWSVSGKVDTDGQAVQPIAADPATIKGWMTLEQISTTYNVPVEEILTEFDLPADTAPQTVIKDLESESVDTTALRSYLKARTAAPQSQ